MTDVKDFGRVAVLLGGSSSEREVSLMSGNGVLDALRKAGVDAHPFDPAVEPIHKLVEGGFDRVFIALHGRFGEDGTLQGALECFGIPYTGPGVSASAVASNKSWTRSVWADAGIPVARGMTVKRVEEAETVLRELGGSVVVKPCEEGSSIGVTKLCDASVEEIREALAEALKFDSSVLVEERIFGREFTVAVIDAKALPIIEIRAPEGDYDFQNKYYTDVVRYDCPADLPAQTAESIARTVEKAFAVLGARGWSRIDVMMREDGSFILLEANTSPGMTPHSLVPMAARAIGMSYQDLCVHILSTAALDSRS